MYNLFADQLINKIFNFWNSITGTSTSTLSANGYVKSIGKCGNPSLLSAFSRKTNFWDVNKSAMPTTRLPSSLGELVLKPQDLDGSRTGSWIFQQTYLVVMIINCPWFLLDSPKKSSLEKHPSKIHTFHQYCKNQPSCQSSNGSWWKCWSRSITITTSLGSSCKQLESLYPRSTYKTFHETDETWQDEVWIYAMYQTVTAVSYINHTMTRW